MRVSAPLLASATHTAPAPAAIADGTAGTVTVATTGRPSAASEVYNIAHNTWTKTTPMRHPRGEMGVTYHGGRIITVGGSLPAFGASVRTHDSFRPKLPA
jgi:hypothetical protein